MVATMAQGLEAAGIVALGRLGVARAGASRTRQVHAQVQIAHGMSLPVSWALSSGLNSGAAERGHG